MKTLCVVLAQGNQSRLPHLIEPKQMLPLPACNYVPILNRTLRQIAAFLGDEDRVEVVTWLPLAQQLLGNPELFSRSYKFGIDVLEDPGNSSLKGLDRYLMKNAKVHRPSAEWMWPEAEYERIVVLLGDVVYSWHCLEKLLEYMPQIVRTSAGEGQGIRFVGTTSLSRSDGELWGFRWHRKTASEFYMCLGTALKNHPPFEDTYQPGQLRRIMWEVQKGTEGLYEWDAVDRTHPAGDYTMDVDLPQHILDLGPVSELAARDDEKHGVTW